MVMHRLTGGLLMALCGLGVVLCVIWWASGKLGNWPTGGMVLLATWLPLQVWHASLTRRGRLETTAAIPLDGPLNLDQQSHRPPSPS